MSSILPLCFHSQAEMSVLLCRHSTFAADLAHVERLETNLRQRNSEITRLNDKIRKLDKEIQESKVSPCSSNLAYFKLHYNTDGQFPKFLILQFRLELCSY